MSERVGSRLHEAADNVRDTSRQRVHDVQLGFWQYMDERPLAIGAAAPAAGVAAGLTVPASRRENEWMGRTRDGLLEQAWTPSDLVEKLRTVSRETEQAVRAEANRALPDTLKG